MPTGIALLHMASSGSFTDKNDMTETHFKWVSIWKFVCISFVFSSSTINFDIYSRAQHYDVRIYDHVILEITIGMTYMCMNIFIKQYTRKIDFNESLNPFLKGINYGILLQTAFITLLNSSFLADSIRYMFGIFKKEPSWTACANNPENVTCIPSKDLVMRCSASRIIKTKLSETSAHLFYMQAFDSDDKSAITTRFFVPALVWILIYMLTSVAENTLIKFCKLVFVWRCVSTTYTTIFMVVTEKFSYKYPLAQLLSSEGPRTYTAAVAHVSYTFGIGVVGVYDLGSMSTYTMVDNAVVIFTFVFTILAFASSFIFRSLYIELTKCVEITEKVTAHYLLFVIFPLGAEFLHAQKVYTGYLYLNLVVSSLIYLTLLTITMSKLLNTNFRSMKLEYIVGILCAMLFFLSLALTYSTFGVVNGLIDGFNLCIVLLGGLKVAVVMWIYGVERFSLDIKFWLGFKPTKFWTISWTLLPVVLMIIVARMLILLIKVFDKDVQHFISGLTWIIITIIILLIHHIKTISKFLMQNNISRACKASPKYGPPEPVDRKRRRLFDDVEHHRHCSHGCIILDEFYECNHLPLRRNWSPAAADNVSLTSIYEGVAMRHHSSIINISDHPT